MTPAQLTQIARDNAAHYDGLALDAHCLADTEYDPTMRAQLAANAAYYEARAELYRAQAATFTQGA